MKNIFAIVFVFSLFLSLPSFAFDASEENSLWLKDKKRLENLTDENRCEEAWNILWPWAKKGNLEARTMLFVAITPMMHVGAIAVPGNSGNYISTMRDSVIMAVHSDGYEEGLSTENDIRGLAQSVYKGSGFVGGYRGRQFLECVQKREGNCSDIAVAEGLVPSFEDYAREKDALIRQGIKGHCMLEHSRENRTNSK